MDRKGEIGIGVLLLTFIGVLVGLILFQAIAQEAGSSTNTVALVNVTTGANNDTTAYLTDYRAISGVIIVNGTDGIDVNSGNYTVTNNVIDPTTGGLAVSIVPVADDLGEWSGDWLISGTAQPTTYIASSGARAITGLIAVFFALAVAIVALVPTLRSEVLRMVSK